VRTILASFLFVDVVGFSKVSASEQHAFKAALVPVLQRALALLPPQDYRLRDTGDGALVTFLGNPEHALFLALSIARDCTDGDAGQVLRLTNLRTGINLGTVRESLDVESRPNYVGDGINAAQRIMDFAQPGQITASRSFKDAMALLDAAYGALFVDLGMRADKHGREHALFAIQPDTRVLMQMQAQLLAEQLQADGPAPVAPAPSAPPPLDIPVLPPAPRAPPRPSFWLVGLALLLVLALGLMRPWSRDGDPQPLEEPLVEPAPPAVDVQPAAPAAPAVPVAAPPSAPVSAAGPAMRPPVAGPSSPPTKVAPLARSAEPAASAVAPQPMRSPGRCARIMEKAGLGEPLTSEEKEELSRSC
jgi:hypothetical protein